MRWRAALGAAVLALGAARSSRAAAAAGIGGASGASGAGSASAGDGTNVKAAPLRLTPEVIAKLEQLLQGADQAAVLEAIKALGQSTAPNAGEPLVGMLSVGARPAAVLAAIDALARFHDARSRDAHALDGILLYAGNRNAEIRRHVVGALAAFKDPRVVPVLMERLGDSAPEVRAAAAEVLAARREKTAAPRLFALLKRNDASAAAPLGALAPIAMVPAIAELKGSIDDASLATTLGELVKRADAGEPMRIDIIRTLARIPGAAATTALVEYVGELAPTDRRPSKTEAERVIDERGKRP